MPPAPRRSLYFPASLLLMGASCGPPPTTAPELAPRPARSAVSEQPSALTSPSSTPALSARAPEAEARSPGAAPRGSAAAYPPPPVPPPHPGSAQPGDGEWKPLGDAALRERAAEGRPALYRTMLHPHVTSRFITLTVVAIDLNALSVRFLPGAKDVASAQLAFAPGLVPKEERDRVVAAFNGGFQPRHGRWGMFAAGVTVMPARKEGCTLGIYGDGSVRLRSWPELAGDASDLIAFRQTPPCLVEAGKLHPNLEAGRDKAWGGDTAGVVTRRRSALGIDPSGRILFYGIGVEASPKLLAQGMRAAGAESAAELDINWNWTRFLLFGSNGAGELRISSSLVDVAYGNQEYIERPAERDFFYLLRAAPAGAL